MKKDFDSWNRAKKKLDLRKVQGIYFKEREIWYCSIGINVGSEQNGHHENFERPVAIIKKLNHHTFLGLPLTSKGGKTNDMYAYKEGGRTYGIRLSQIRLWDSRRLLRKTSNIPRGHFLNIKLCLRDLFK